MPRRRKLVATEQKKSSFLTLEDNSNISAPAVDFFGLDKKGRGDPISQSARLADQFVSRNLSLLSAAQIQCRSEFDGREVRIHLRTGNTIGAVPLISPVTGKTDHGVIVNPRFEWDGIGAMLGRMGWRVAPIPLKLETFKGSARNVPPWVLSSMILVRISNLLRTISRKFEMASEIRNAPRGRVRWNEYACRSITTGRFLSIPCTFPDLRHDRQLLGTVRYCLERVIEALQSQLEHGTFVQRLINLAVQLLTIVQDVPAFVPAVSQLQTWLQKPLKSEFYIDGLQALHWTLEKRGLAGASTIDGIPWVMEMDRFFEAWVETLFHSLARSTGGLLKIGRLHQTTRAIAWEPPYLGSQNSLRPDVWVQWGSTTLVVDAKYKRHFEDLQSRSWGSMEASWREDHRSDLLQVLAYANLAQSRKIISCLVYPCSPDQWTYLRDTNRLFHKAEITIGERELHLWMTAVPMRATLDEVYAPIARQLIPVLQTSA